MTTGILAVVDSAVVAVNWGAAAGPAVATNGEVAEVVVIVNDSFLVVNGTCVVVVCELL